MRFLRLKPLGNPLGLVSGAVRFYEKLYGEQIGYILAEVAERLWDFETWAQIRGRGRGRARRRNRSESVPRAQEQATLEFSDSANNR